MAQNAWGHIKVMLSAATQCAEKSRANRCLCVNACACMCVQLSPYSGFSSWDTAAYPGEICCPCTWEKAKCDYVLLQKEHNTVCMLLKYAEVQTMMAQTYHFCWSTMVLDSGDSLVSAYIKAQVSHLSRSYMWTQSKQSIAFDLYVRYNVTIIIKSSATSVEVVAYCLLWLRWTCATTDGQWCNMGIQRWRGKYTHRFGLVAGAVSCPPYRLQLNEVDTQRSREMLELIQVTFLSPL